MKLFGWLWTLVGVATFGYIGVRLLIEGPLIGQIAVLIICAVLLITWWISVAADSIVRRLRGD